MIQIMILQAEFREHIWEQLGVQLKIAAEDNLN